MSNPTNTPVPPLNLADNFKPLRDEILAEITAICDSGQYILGPRVETFEKNLAQACGAKFALGMSSGTDALLAAMMALEIGRGDEVLCPAFTFFATAGVVHRVGARPVFVDIDPDTFNLSVADVEAKLTQRTRAVVPVHLYGRMADMKRLNGVVSRHGVHVIEDAAQAILATTPEYPGQTAGAIGAYGALSFYPTKNIGAIGDAGALLTNDERLYQRAKQCRLHGETQKYHHQFVGGNFRIDALQAAILDVKLRRLEAWTAARIEVARRYHDLFTQRGLAPELVRLPETGPGRHVFHQYVIRTARRDELMKFLQERRIGCGIYYPVPLHLQECFAFLGGKPGDLPHSERAAAEVLALPMYPELTEPQQATVVAAIAESFGK